MIRVGGFERDVIQFEHESIATIVRPLLRRVMTGSVADGDLASPLVEIRDRTLAAIASLPPAMRSIETASPYPAAWSPELQSLRNRTLAEHGQQTQPERPA